MPIDKGIDIWHNFGTQYFLERREIGVFNIGGAGSITADGVKYELGYKDCLYITQGTKEVLFASKDAANPAKFYMVSAPAHRAYETKLHQNRGRAKSRWARWKRATKRVINQFIHPDVLPTCQLSMGMTVLEPGSVWNTCRRTPTSVGWKCICILKLPEENVVFHMMGEGQETRQYRDAERAGGDQPELEHPRGAARATTRSSGRWAAKTRLRRHGRDPDHRASVKAQKTAAGGKRASGKKNGNERRFFSGGKVALVTGASYGIGFASIAEGMAKAGATIVFNDIKQGAGGQGACCIRGKRALKPTDMYAT